MRRHSIIFMFTLGLGISSQLAMAQDDELDITIRVIGEDEDPSAFVQRIELPPPENFDVTDVSGDTDVDESRSGEEVADQVSDEIGESAEESTATAINATLDSISISGAKARESDEPDRNLPGQVVDVLDEDLPLNDDLTDDVDEATGEIVDVIEDNAGELDDVIDNVAENTGDAVDDITDNVGDTVDDVTGNVDDTTGDITSDTVDSTTDVVDTLDDTSDSTDVVTDTVGDSTDATGDLTDGTVDALEIDSQPADSLNEIGSPGGELSGTGDDLVNDIPDTGDVSTGL